MNDIPEDEARALLALPSECVDIGEWVASVRSGHIYTVECGLLRNDTYANLHVSMIYSYRPDIKVTHMIFTVFCKTVYGQDRIFQLDINNNKLAGKNKHNLPHYHWGDKKFYNEEMIAWNFQQAINFFIQETKINFLPPLRMPGFELT